MKEKTTKESECQKQLTFQQLIQHIKQLDAVLNRQEIETLLARVVCDSDDYRGFMANIEPYSRISVVKSRFETAELFVMTWYHNQQSVIHDHFQSACGIRVLQGKMTETLYELVEDNKVRQTISKDWLEGETTSSEASFEIHKISNQADEILVTLHIYSMPLDPNKMQCFVEID